MATLSGPNRYYPDNQKRTFVSAAGSIERDRSDGCASGPHYAVIVHHLARGWRNAAGRSGTWETT